MVPQDPKTTERPPIVVVLGHVDHGKSTLLDFIRKSNTVLSEAGGITQHVAAYEVTHTPKISLSTPGPKRITFVDTPGHAAFKTIRARGANVADIAILVVAADDGVKAQTLEALESIREANIPFIVAINKIDKPNANIERTQATLLEQGVYLEKLGGDVPWAAISAKAGTGVLDLLDLILLVAEVEGFTGDEGLPAEGYCIEAHRDQKRGIAATLIITNGTLEQGHAVCIGRAIAPVRIMENYAGVSIKRASFSSPVLLTGFDELPAAGEHFQAYKSKRDAESARSAAIRAGGKPSPAHPEQEPDGAGTERFTMPIVVRADTTGSLEAIAHEVARVGDEHARVAIVLSGIGTVSENDVKAATASSAPAVVISFNVGVDPVAQERARQNGIRIERFDIIYKLVERLEEVLRESAPKRVVEETVGRARILRHFSSRKKMHVVGGSVSEGYIARSASVRVVRRNQLIGVGKIKNIQTNKQDVARAESGSEFGAQIEAVFEIAQGDLLECFTSVTK